MARFWLLVLLLLSWSPAILAQDFSFRLDRFSPTKETSVGFSIRDGGAVPSSFLTGLGMLRTIETQRFVLSIDTESFERRGSVFKFDAYVSTKNGSQVHKYTVSQDPIGAFKDGIFPVPFHITANGEDDVETVDLPVFSTDGSDNLALDLPKTPLRVGSGSGSRSDLGLTNQLENLHVSILKAEISSTACEGCWRSLSVKPNLDVLAPKKGTSLILERQPNTLKALLKSISLQQPGAVHDTLLITVSSVSELGGLPSPQEFKLTVTFAPPALYLFLSVIVGAVLGGGLRLALKAKPASPASQPAAPPVAQAAGQAAAPAPAPPPAKDRYPRLKEFGVAFTVAIIFWFVVLMLFSYMATQLTIFGLVVDPSQVLPAGLITLLAAGGPPLIDKLKELWKAFREAK
jgi:hypothetical protein